MNRHVAESRHSNVTASRRTNDKYEYFRKDRASYREVCQPNQRAGSDEGRRTDGKKADSEKKENRLYLGVDEQAAHPLSLSADFQVR